MRAKIIHVARGDKPNITAPLEAVVVLLLLWCQELNTLGAHKEVAGFGITDRVCIVGVVFGFTCGASTTT